MSQSVVQVSSESGLRPPETRILSEKPRSATTAVGTARQGRVVIRPVVEGLIARFDGLAEPLARLCLPGWLHGVGRGRKDQKQPGTVGLLSPRGMPQPVVSDLVKAAWQYVLKKAPRNSTPGSRSVHHASALRSFQRKVTWVWSMPRIRALVIAVRKTYRDR